MKMMKKFLLSLMLAIAGCFCFAKPVTVEYYDGLTFETDTECIGKVFIKEYLMDELGNRLEKNSFIITDIDICDMNKVFSEETPESDKAFYEEITKGPYSNVWICYSWGVIEWFVTDTDEVYCVCYEWIENEEKRK